MAHNPGSPQ